MISSVPVEQSGAAVICQQCGTNFILPDLPDTLNPERSPPARSLPLYVLPVIAGAGLVLAISQYLPSKPAVDSVGSSPVATPPVIATTKQTVRPRTAPPPLPKPENSGNGDPVPAEIYGPAQAVVSSAPAATPGASSWPPLPSGPDSAPPPVSERSAKPILDGDADTETVPATRETDPPLPTNSSVPVTAIPVVEDTSGDSPVPSGAGQSDPENRRTTAAMDAVKARQDSRATLEHFLLATTIEERLSVSQNPDKIKSGMKNYYQSNPIGPLALTELTLLTEGEVPNSNQPFHLYNVFLKDREAPIPVAVEQTKDGFRVDWESFTESVSTRLHDFFAAPTDARGRFRVLLRRAHYFGPPVPGQDTTRLAYSVEPPAREETFHVWADVDSSVYQEKLATGDRASWEAESYVIVELVWRGDDRRGRWVGLGRIVSDSWRSD